MTDRQGALGVLSNGDSAERVRALEAFHSRYAHDQLVIDKWFSTQALSPRDDTFKTAVALTGHPDLPVDNTNRLRALLGGFAANQRDFVSVGGTGYRFLADMILHEDRSHPPSAVTLEKPQ